MPTFASDPEATRRALENFARQHGIDPTQAIDGSFRFERDTGDDVTVRWEGRITITVDEYNALIREMRLSVKEDAPDA